MLLLSRREKEKGAETKFEKNNGWKLPKFDEKHEYKDPRSPTNSKQNELKESHTAAQYNQTYKRQRQNFESSKGKGNHYIQQTLPQLKKKRKR